MAENVARWKKKPRNFKTVKGTGADKGFWIKPGGGTPPNPYAGLPQHSQDYLSGLDQNVLNFEKSAKQSQGWLKDALGANTAYTQSARDNIGARQSAAMQAMLQGFQMSGLTQSAMPGGMELSGPTASGFNQQTGAAAASVGASLGSAQNSAALANFGTENFAARIAAGAQQNALAIGERYKRERDEQVFKIREAFWQFQQEKKWRNQQLRLQQAQLAAELSMAGQVDPLEAARFEHDVAMDNAQLELDYAEEAGRNARAGARGGGGGGFRGLGKLTAVQKRAVNVASEIVRDIISQGTMATINSQNGRWLPRDGNGNLIPAGKGKVVRRRMSKGRLIKWLTDEFSGELSRAQISKIVAQMAARSKDKKGLDPWQRVSRAQNTSGAAGEHWPEGWAD
jgi:hypothetical protein